MTIETALPAASEAPAGGQQQNADQLAANNPDEGASQSADEDGAGGDGEQQQARKEKTPEQRELDRMRRGIDRRTAKLAETRAELEASRRELEALRGSRGDDTLRAPESDDEPVSLSRAQLDELVKREAQRLAPTLKQQEAEMEHRKQVVQSLSKDLGQERFDALAADLDEAVGGLVERDGRTPRPAADAIFHADDPKAVIEYLADPENDAEAQALGQMTHLQAGRAIAKLEAKLVGLKAERKPQRSNAPAPLEPSRGRGTASDMPDPADIKAYYRWASKRDRAN